MQCPKCEAAMQAIETEKGTVDRCSQCQGLWFDLLEDEDHKPLAEAIDTGPAELGATYHAIDRIHCPVCPDSPLIRMVDPVQPHIWFESCTTCYGRFFDAGEFRDLAEVTLQDFMKRFSVQARA